MKKLFPLFLILLSLTSCHPWDHPYNEDEHLLTRTVLVYMVAENSLSYGSFHEQDLNELLSVSHNLPEKCEMLIYVDDTDLPRLYSVKRDGGSEGVKLIKQWNEDFDSCDPEILHNLMQMVMALYPSKGYGLVFWSHGNAWMPRNRAAAAPRRTIGIDNGNNSYSNSGSKMEISQLREALEGLPPLDFLMFDACFMQTIEVAYELRNVTRYIVASPAEIPNPGAPYDYIMAPMFHQPLDVEGIIDQYYHYYADSIIPIKGGNAFQHGAVLSVVDCSNLDALQQATQRMIETYASADEDKLSEVLRYFPVSYQTIPEFYDMKAYMRHLITSESDLAAWQQIFDAAVPYRRATDFWYTSYTARYMYLKDLEEYGGISMFVPQPDNYFQLLVNQFKATSWYPVSGWAKYY